MWDLVIFKHKTTVQNNCNQGGSSCEQNRMDYSIKLTGNFGIYVIFDSKFSILVKSIVELNLYTESGKHKQKYV